MASVLGTDWFILIFARPGNCKSLEQARISYQLIREYARTERRFPTLPKRILFTNQLLNHSVREFGDAYKDGHLMYWSHPEDFRYCPRKDCWKRTDGQLHLLHDVDLMVDEGATLFPADHFADTPYWLRKMWAQHRHNGNRIVMLSQDFKAIDINCRRMLWKAYYMKKRLGSRDITPTLPPLYKWTWRNFLMPFRSVIWGIYSKQMIDPQLIENDASVVLSVQVNREHEEKLNKMDLIGWPKFHLITWKKCNFFDTTQDVKEYEPKREYEHIEGKCLKPACGYIHISHKLK